MRFTPEQLMGIVSRSNLTQIPGPLPPMGVDYGLRGSLLRHPNKSYGLDPIGGFLSRHTPPWETFSDEIDYLLSPRGTGTGFDLSGGFGSTRTGHELLNPEYMGDAPSYSPPSDPLSAGAAAVAAPYGGPPSLGAMGGFDPLSISPAGLPGPVRPPTALETIQNVAQSPLAGNPEAATRQAANVQELADSTDDLVSTIEGAVRSFTGDDAGEKTPGRESGGPLQFLEGISEIGGMALGVPFNAAGNLLDTVVSPIQRLTGHPRARREWQVMMRESEQAGEDVKAMGQMEANLALLQRQHPEHYQMFVDKYGDRDALIERQNNANEEKSAGADWWRAMKPRFPSLKEILLSNRDEMLAKRIRDIDVQANNVSEQKSFLDRIVQDAEAKLGREKLRAETSNIYSNIEDRKTEQLFKAAGLSTPSSHKDRAAATQAKINEIKAKAPLALNKQVMEILKSDMSPSNQQLLLKRIGFGTEITETWVDAIREVVSGDEEGTISLSDPTTDQLTKAFPQLEDLEKRLKFETMSAQDLADYLGPLWAENKSDPYAEREYDLRIKDLQAQEKRRELVERLTK